MNTTIIFAHPWLGSYNKAILDRVVSKLNAKGEEYTLIDLYRDDFDPVLSEDDLKIYAKGRSSDLHVIRYNQILDKTDRVILIFPIWWYDMPAILRGFFDKVMLNGSAWYADDEGMHAIRNIPETLVITTSASSTDQLVEIFGDPVNGTIIGSTFRFIGFNNAEWHNLGGIDTTATPKELADFLDMIYETV